MRGEGTAKEAGGKFKGQNCIYAVLAATENEQSKSKLSSVLCFDSRLTVNGRLVTLFFGVSQSRWVGGLLWVFRVEVRSELDFSRPPASTANWLLLTPQASTFMAACDHLKTRRFLAGT